jgi:hypothetical protein
MLRTAIDTGLTPDFAAEKAWEDALGKNQGGVLVGMIENGDWTGLKAHPDLVAHGGWIDSFREALRARTPGQAAPVVAAEPEEVEEEALGVER